MPVFEHAQTRHFHQEKTEEKNQSKDNDMPEFDQQFVCVVECDALQKNFEHKDELDLHMEFYHGAVESSTQ